MISTDRLIKAEISRALDGTTPVAAYSDQAEWYPDNAIELSPANRQEVGAWASEVLESLQGNRATRRKAKHKALKHGKLRQGFTNELTANIRESALEDVRRIYPMTEQDARIIGLYWLGQATREQATEAFLESLRNPRWMMQWFQEHHQDLTFFIEWIRGPAKKMATAMLDMSNKLGEVHASPELSGSKEIASLLSAKQWDVWREEWLLRTARNIYRTMHGQDGEALTVSLLEDHCPGFSTGLSALISAWRSATTQNARRPVPNDFADAVHTMYAPYVDVFRADSFMAPHVEIYVRQHKTTVVRKLDMLEDVINRILLDRQ